MATITRPWIGRRSRLDGPRRQRGRRRRAVVGQGRARYRVLGGALAGRTVPACSSSCSGGWTSSNAQGGSAPGPGSRAAATLVTGAAGPPTPTRILPGSCRSRWPPWAPARGWAGPSRSRQVKARSWGWRVATSTVTGPKDGQRRVVTPDRPPVRNAGRRTSATFHLDPWPGAGPGAWSAASGPPGGRSAAQDQLGGPGILASRRVAGIGWWTASPARGAKLGVVGHVRRGPHRRHRRPGPPCGPGARRGQRPGVEPGERCSAGGCRAGRRTVSMLRMAGSAITIRHARPAWLLSQGIIVATAATWRSSGPWILPTWPPCLVRFCSNRPPATQRPFPVVCNATAVGCVAMGVKRDPAVRLCVTCVQLESADQFAPGRRKCVACQQTQPSRADCPGRPHDPPRRRPGPSARPGAAASGAGKPGRLPDAVPGRTAGGIRNGSTRPGPQADGQPRPQGTRAAAPLPLCRAVPSSVTTPFEAARPTGGHLRSAHDYARGRVDVAAACPIPPPTTPARGGSQTAGRTAGNPGTRRRPVRPRGTAVLGRWPTRCRQGSPRSAGTPTGEAVGPQRCAAVAPAAIPRFPTGS